MANHARRLLLVALGIGLPLVAGEVWLRASEVAPSLEFGWKDLFARPHELNQLGYRGQPIAYRDGEFVIVLVGDSQVAGDACLYEVMPERRLQHHLGRRTTRPVRVFSIGSIGYGQDQELLGLQEYLASYRADAVVVWFTDGNDTWNNASATHGSTHPKPTFWLDGAGALQGPSARIGQPVYSRLRLLGKLQQLLSPDIEAEWSRRLPTAYVPMTSYDGPAVSDWKLLATTAAEMAEERTGLTLALEPPSPRVRHAIELTNKLLHRMAETTRAADGRFLSFVVERPDLPVADGVYVFSGLDGKPRYVRSSAARHRQSVADVHAGIDLVRLQVKVAPFCTEGDPHFNMLAVDQLMADLAGELAVRLKL